MYCIFNNCDDLYQLTHVQFLTLSSQAVDSPYPPSSQHLKISGHVFRMHMCCSFTDIVRAKIC